MTGSPAVVRAAGVRKGFATGAGVRTVLAGVDLTVAGGELVAMAGRSGSGKTTLLSILAGWERPDAGTVRVGGGEPRADAPWRETAVLPQTLGLLDELTVGENVTLPLRLDRVPAGADEPAGAGGPVDAAELLDRLGLAHLAARRPSEVSLGEQQRAALARAVVVRPRLLLADEPIAHQNRGWAEVMTAVLRDLADAGTACVLATHDAVAFAVADRVVELHDGRVRAQPGPAVRPAPDGHYPGPSASQETSPPC